jgi:hypothetical protein
MPPQVAGNTKAVRRAPDVIADGLRRPGKWMEGGMWVRGLCEECNHHAGNNYDNAYADFTTQLARLSSPTARRLAAIPGEAPGVFFAPGLVARAVMYGMFAINPRLRILFPELAEDLAAERKTGHATVRWPSKLALKVARTHPRFPHEGVITSGIWSMRVMNERVTHGTFGDIVWPPATWCLVPNDLGPQAQQLGPQIADYLADASDWVQYRAERTSVDLRHLTRQLPQMLHPMLARTNDWVELFPEEKLDSGAVVVYGKRS